MFLRIFEANNKTYNIMESSNIDYEIAFDSFKNNIKEMAVGSIKRTGIKKIAKPVLLLTIIKGIEDGIFKQNYFEYEILEKIYKSIFNKYTDIATERIHTTILSFLPFTIKWILASKLHFSKFKEKSVNNLCCLGPQQC